MNDQITVRGHVATEPRHQRTASGLDITSFRLASQQRRYDAKQGTWVAQETNWYTVSAFRALATAATESLVKGQRVMVVGRLRVREWESGDRRGTSIDIEADGIACDIAWRAKQADEAPPTVESVAGVRNGSDVAARAGTPLDGARPPAGSGAAEPQASWAPAPLDDTPF